MVEATTERQLLRLDAEALADRCPGSQFERCVLDCRDLARRDQVAIAYGREARRVDCELVVAHVPASFAG